MNPLMGFGLGTVDLMQAGVLSRTMSQMIQGWNIIMKANSAAEQLTAK
jgi:hypothetical protein